jgi:hypothetical protein
VATRFGWLWSQHQTIHVLIDQMCTIVLARMRSHELTDVLVITYNLKVLYHLRLKWRNCCRCKIVRRSLLCCCPNNVLFTHCCSRTYWSIAVLLICRRVLISNVVCIDFLKYSFTVVMLTWRHYLLQYSWLSKIFYANILRLHKKNIWKSKALGGVQILYNCPYRNSKLLVNLHVQPLQ